MKIYPFSHRKNVRIPPYEYDLIISHILKMSIEYVIAHPEHILTDKQSFVLEQLLNRRLTGEPIAYLLGRKYFFGLDFTVDRNVLIPRPETEHLVESALQILNTQESRQSKTAVVDVGTGSGCIIIALAMNQPDRRDIVWVGSDISASALRVAKKNARRHGLTNRVNFLKSDLLDFLTTQNRNRHKKVIADCDNLVITANLPYLSRQLYATAPVSVKGYEPRTALFSGEDGLDHYRRIFGQVAQLISVWPQKKFSIVIEISPEQKKALAALVNKMGPGAKAEFIKDLAGKWRCAIIKIQPQVNP